MASTQSLRQEFEKFMDSRGVKYTTVDESDNIVVLPFNRGSESTRVYVDFDESENASTVHFCVQDFAKVKSQEELPKALLVVNHLNQRFRWLKFYVDVEDLGITADSDAKVYPGTVGDECTEICFRSASIIEDAFEELDDIIVHASEDGPSKDEMIAMLKELMSGLID